MACPSVTSAAKTERASPAIGGSAPKKVVVTIGTAWSTPGIARSCSATVSGKGPGPRTWRAAVPARSSIASVNEASVLALMTRMATTSATPQATPAVARAARTLRGITGLEVVGKRVKVERGLIVEYRVDMKITFVLD